MTEEDYRSVIRSKKLTYLATATLPYPLDLLAVYCFPRIDERIATNGTIFFEESGSEAPELEDRELRFLEQQSRYISAQLQLKLSGALPDYSFEVEAVNRNRALSRDEKEFYEVSGIDPSQFVGLRILKGDKQIGSVDMTGSGFMFGFILVELGGLHGFGRRRDVNEEIAVQTLKEDLKITASALDNTLQVLSSGILPDIDYSKILPVEVKAQRESKISEYDIHGTNEHIIEMLSKRS